MSITSPTCHISFVSKVITSPGLPFQPGAFDVSKASYWEPMTNSLKPISLQFSTSGNCGFALKCMGSEPASTTDTGSATGRSYSELKREDGILGVDTDTVIGGGGNDKGGDDSGGGDDGGDGEEGGDDEEEKEFGPILKFEEIMKEVEAKGVKLPQDMFEAAETTGIREVFLRRYLDLQGAVWPLGFLMKGCSMLRNRMLADPSFLFKVGTEIVIDSCCATFAEFQKRGKDFWAEFELYAADLLVGIVVDIALVGMLAPYARIGQPSISRGLLGRVQHACASLPSSVFEAERPGCNFSVKQRIATFFYKVTHKVEAKIGDHLTATHTFSINQAQPRRGVLYGSVGFGCGLIGQGIANMIMNAKRRIKKTEEDIPVPPLVQSAALWAIFLAVSSNARYQLINGLESLVEASPLAKQIPPVAMAFTIGVRFANNIYGGMQFIDWAKWSGVQ